MSAHKKARLSPPTRWLPQSPDLLRMIVGKLSLNQMLPLLSCCGDLAAAAKSELAGVTNLALAWGERPGTNLATSGVGMLSREHGAARVLRVKDTDGKEDWSILRQWMPHVNQLDLTERVSACPPEIVAVYGPQLRSLCCSVLGSDRAVRQADYEARSVLSTCRKLERLVICSDYADLLDLCPQLVELQVCTTDTEAWVRALNRGTHPLEILRIRKHGGNYLFQQSATKLDLAHSRLERIDLSSYLIGSRLPMERLRYASLHGHMNNQIKQISRLPRSLEHLILNGEGVYVDLELAQILPMLADFTKCFLHLRSTSLQTYQTYLRSKYPNLVPTSDSSYENWRFWTRDLSR